MKGIFQIRTIFQQLPVIHNSMFLCTVMLQGCILSMTHSVAPVGDRGTPGCPGCQGTVTQILFSSLMRDLDFFHLVWKLLPCKVWLTEWLCTLLGCNRKKQEHVQFLLFGWLLFCCRCCWVLLLLFSCCCLGFFFYLFCFVFTWG